MANTTRRSRLFQFVLLTIALNGCAAAVDENEDPSRSQEATGATSEALLNGGATDADAGLSADPADCDAAPAKPAARSDQYNEFISIMETASVNADAAPAGNSCTAACRCCRWGNRFCCSHCNWCTGPIKATGGVLAP